MSNKDDWKPQTKKRNKNKDNQKRFSEGLIWNPKKEQEPQISNSSGREEKSFSAQLLHNDRKMPHPSTVQGSFCARQGAELSAAPQIGSELKVVAVRALRNKGQDDFSELQIELLRKRKLRGVSAAGIISHEKGEIMIIGELAIFPTSEGASVSRYVKEAIKAIEASGLKSVTGGMATTIEAPDLAALLEVVKKAHQAILDMGVRRIHIDLHVDHRLDKDASVESKLRAVGKA